MGSPESREEIEVKYRLAGPEEAARLRARLAALGARPAGREAEDNVLFDHPDGRLLASHRVLRLRTLDGGPGGRLTFKGPATYAGALKRRVEHETAVADVAAARAILEALGYVPTVAYAKQRETWRLDGAEVALDELAFGHFCEIEGAPDAIARVVAALGLAPEAAEPAGYPALTARYQAARRPSP
ncbi:MAG TPA: class IV adenylate cyclase [Chloroflexota bacterium]|nr:class IV adenylate cyclase [Chloroflexota bacterium]